MKKPTHYRPLLFAAMIVITGSMLVFGILGFLAFGSNTQGLITENLNLVAPKPFTITVQACLIFAILFVSYLFYFIFFSKFFLNINKIQIIIIYRLIQFNYIQ